MTQADKIRLQLEGHREALVERVLKLAFDQDGNVSNRALELALTRLAPVPRQDSERVIIPGFKDALTLQAKAEAVIDAIATGEVSAEAGTKLLQVLDTYGRAIITTDLEKRLAALEEGRAPLTIDVQPSVEELI
jgi:hypothetical protein